MVKLVSVLPIKIGLPEGFLNPEVRCGYEITTKLKKIWAVELDLLAELLRVCKKYDIKCSLAFGSLIGTIRHKGFIPWDDDLDVMFERSEYEKLLSVGAEEFKHPYFFQFALSDRKKFSPLARLRNSLTTGYVTGDPKDGYNSGIYLDLYCFDANPQQRIRYLWKHFLKRVVGKCLNFYYDDKPRDSSVGEKIKRAARPFARLISYEKWWALYCRIMSLYNEKEDHFSHMLTAQISGRRDCVLRTELTDVIMMPYEFIEVPIIRAYDALLRRTYGDYMQFPPASERGKWHEGIIHFEPEIPYKEYLKGV